MADFAADGADTFFQDGDAYINRLILVQMNYNFNLCYVGLFSKAVI